MTIFLNFQRKLFAGILLLTVPAALLFWQLSHPFTEAYLIGLAAALISLLLKFRLAHMTLKRLTYTLPWHSLCSMSLYMMALYGGYKIHAKHLLGLAGVSIALGLVLLVLFFLGLTELDLLGTGHHSSVFRTGHRKDEK
ncbi:MAG TPA: hypothetical protein PLY90_06785 [Candidatus Hydrogenedentes bacterium]|jgi:hypothetical protein|nr:MAG: hypothetical protein BWY07_00700 [Candidatus Hydrogenedentes bacterium ADurb.Bin170]HNZ47722.1 hypothetical protein [Candidatus Hydrogenedentota bacterium]HOD95107.1 hypothetical protein [Candidatus Hydrogenedentota bacterium]HOM47195.1 hypothetical protein [Candidatus Hydrogenedentota bacterium]HOR51376.1 hypothetical protein [Candidatus Hydrogenedentota bacterium]